MTELPLETVNNLVTLSLSDVSPSSLTPKSILHGVVAIKWPYSSSTQKLTFLLADPDPKKRAAGGEVKVTLVGEAAEVLDQIESGETICIAPPPNQELCFALVEQDGSGRAKWHITFTQGCILGVIFVFPPT